MKYQKLIAALAVRLGSRAAVARALGVNVDTLKNRTDGKSTIRREHEIAAEAILERIDR